MNTGTGDEGVRSPSAIAACAYVPVDEFGSMAGIFKLRIKAPSAESPKEPDEELLARTLNLYLIFSPVTRFLNPGSIVVSFSELTGWYHSLPEWRRFSESSSWIKRKSDDEEK